MSYPDHPFIDPRQTHSYEGQPPGVYADPYAFGDEASWVAANGAMRTAAERQARLAAGYTDGGYTARHPANTSNLEPFPKQTPTVDFDGYAISPVTPGSRMRVPAAFGGPSAFGGWHVRWGQGMPPVNMRYFDPEVGQIAEGVDDYGRPLYRTRPGGKIVQSEAAAHGYPQSWSLALGAIQTTIEKNTYEGYLSHAQKVELAENFGLAVAPFVRANAFRIAQILAYVQVPYREYLLEITKCPENWVGIVTTPLVQLGPIDPRMSPIEPIHKVLHRPPAR